mmetsp:Transcript_24157/g.27858  ORF Transcript_24157/g.27858 Transcript_24157/m.27858 type:complete len:81 (+) Transcript_24157:128-370(+)
MQKAMFCNMIKMSETKSLSPAGKLFVAINNRMNLENMIAMSLEELSSENSLCIEEEEDEISLCGIERSEIGNVGLTLLHK